MCVAYPGTVIELLENGKKALVDFSGTRTVVQTGFLLVKEQDRVLVHAGCVLQVLKKEDADAMDEIFAEIEAMEETADTQQKEERMTRGKEERRTYESGADSGGIKAL